MADNKGTPEPNTRHEFPEVKGKIVDSVELVAEADYYAIAIRFQDNTALNFALESCIFTFPVLADWTGGEETILKQYQAAPSQLSRS